MAKIQSCIPHAKPYMNKNNSIGWLVFGGYKKIMMLTILPPSSAILLASRAIYSCFPLKAIQYHIIMFNVYSK